MPTKKELQEQADALGIDYTTSDTKADLEALIEGATETGTQETGDFRCPNCGKLADHIHARGV